MIDLGEAKKLVSENPFHNVKRLLRNQGISLPSIVGGDCFELALLSKEVYGGEIITCRYANSGDWHWINMQEEGYIDLTSKKLFVRKDTPSFMRGLVVRGETNDYFKTRDSLLNKIFVARTWHNGKFYDMRGCDVSINGDLKNLSVEEQEEMLITVFKLPNHCIKYLKPYFINSSIYAIE